jgi:hypothetical protein
VRIGNQAKAANTYGVAVPAKYKEFFRADRPPPLTEGDKFRLEVADKALQNTLEDLVLKAKEVVDGTTLRQPTSEGIERVQKCFHLLVPAQDCSSLCEILNAAWGIYDNYPPAWDKIERVKKDKARILRELVLKTIEVFEIQTIQREGG